MKSWLVRLIVGLALPEVEHHYPGFSIRLLPFLCREESGEPPAVEHSEIRWIKLAQCEVLDWAEADVPIWRALLVAKESVSLTTLGKPLGEKSRQAGGKDFLLCRFDIVFEPAESDLHSVGIVDAVACSPVTITWLPTEPVLIKYFDPSSMSIDSAGISCTLLLRTKMRGT